jgi:hypothetical protein
MKCNKCGNTKYFKMLNRIATYNHDLELWENDDDWNKDGDIIMCEECHSMNIEDENYKFTIK